MTTKTRIQQKTDTLANWSNASNNPILLAGELAVVKCENQIRFKIGNGTSHFNDLPFVDQYVLSSAAIDVKMIKQGLSADTTSIAVAEGAYVKADAAYSHALGINAHTLSADQVSFVWNGDGSNAPGTYYNSHGQGSFSINPNNGLSGVYIGERSLASILEEVANKPTIKIINWE